MLGRLPELVLRLRPGNPVNGDAESVLKPKYRTLCLLPEDAVYASVVVSEKLQTSLQLVYVVAAGAEAERLSAERKSG